MRIAVMSDIHGNSVALERVLADAGEQSVRDFVVLGDVFMMGPAPAGVLGTLRDLRPSCWIKGNTDMWFEEIGEGWEPQTPIEKMIEPYFYFARERLRTSDIEFITGLPTEKPFTFAGTTILCVHGSPGSVNKGMDHRTPADQLELMTKDAREKIIVCGHTHFPFVGRAGDKRIFNVGSVGRLADGDGRASYGIIDFASGRPAFEIRRVGYPVEETVEMAKAAGFPDADGYARALGSGNV